MMVWCLWSKCGVDGCEVGCLVQLKMGMVENRYVKDGFLYKLFCTEH